jgi:hypothetical protein
MDPSGGYVNAWTNGPTAAFPLAIYSTQPSANVPILQLQQQQQQQQQQQGMPYAQPLFGETSMLGGPVPNMLGGPPRMSWWGLAVPIILVAIILVAIIFLLVKPVHVEPPPSNLPVEPNKLWYCEEPGKCVQKANGQGKGFPSKEECLYGCREPDAPKKIDCLTRKVGRLTVRTGQCGEVDYEPSIEWPDREACMGACDAPQRFLCSTDRACVEVAHCDSDADANCFINAMPSKDLTAAERCNAQCGAGFYCQEADGTASCVPLFGVDLQDPALPGVKCTRDKPCRGSCSIGADLCRKIVPGTRWRCEGGQCVPSSNGGQDGYDTVDACLSACCARSANGEIAKCANRCIAPEQKCCAMSDGTETLPYNPDARL